MASLFGQLLPLILGAVLAPIWVILVLLMLASPGGVLKAAAFVLGMTVTRVAQGIIFGVVMEAAADGSADDGGKSTVALTLSLLIGLLLLIAAFKKWRKEEDPDEPPPKWLQSLDQITPVKAFGLGALGVAVGPKLWAFTLSALAVITEAELGRQGEIVAYAAYIILAQIVLILAILVSAVARERSRAFLQRAIDWLTTYNRPISVTVGLLFGLYFTWGGVSGLLGLSLR